MKNIFLTLSITIVAACIGCSGPISQNSSTRTSDELRVMTYNIRYNNPGDGEHAWPNRSSRVASSILFSEADLVGVQEALRGQLEDLDGMLSGYDRLGVGRDDGRKAGEYTAIYFREARFRLVDSGTFWLSKTPDVVASKDWDAAITRIATWGVFEDLGSKKKVFFMNTHFDHVGQVARENSAELLLQKITELSGDAPVVLTGDFNVTPDNPVYAKLTSSLRDTQQISRRRHHGPEGTFYDGFVVTHKPGRRIDYIFVNDKVNVLAHATLSDNWEGSFASDHLAVVATIKTGD